MGHWLGCAAATLKWCHAVPRRQKRDPVMMILMVRLQFWSWVQGKVRVSTSHLWLRVTRLLLVQVLRTHTQQQKSNVVAGAQSWGNVWVEPLRFRCLDYCHLGNLQIQYMQHSDPEPGERLFDSVQATSPNHKCWTNLVQCGKRSGQSTSIVYTCAKKKNTRKLCDIIVVLPKSK